MVPAVYLDPPWRGRAASAIAPMRTITRPCPGRRSSIICARRAPRLLPDAWAFMWIPRAHLLAPVEADLEVMVKATGEMVQALVDLPLAWACQLALGMDSYSTCFVWTKTDEDHPDVSGSGLIAWDQDELLLLFKRGQGLPKPSGAEKFGSNHRERPREHSRKPDFYRHMIATMVGCDAEGAPLPVLELFARVDAEHPLPPGWLAAGNQAAPAAELEAPAPDQTESSFAVERMPSDAGETTMAAADATSDSRASAAAAVVDMIAADPNDRAPYDAADVIEIDQLAGSDYLQPAELRRVRARNASRIAVDRGRPGRSLERISRPTRARARA
jgi:N6-adenosine-specific RNA methylase IME4